MGEVWVAAVGATVAVVGAGYSIYQSQSAINAANSTHPAAFVPIKADEVNALATATDTEGYKRSDQDFAKRFPLLAAGKTANINSSLNDLKGKVSPGVASALKSTGLDGEGLGGSGFQQATNLGLDVLQKEKRDRSYFQNLFAQNPHRQFGLSGSDAAHIAISNTASQGNYNQGLFGSHINQYNTQMQQGAINQATGIDAIGSIAGIFGQFNQPKTPNLLDATTYSDWRQNAQGSSSTPFYPETTTTG